MLWNADLGCFGVSLGNAIDWIFNFLVHGRNYIYFKSRAKRDEGHPELGRAGLDPAPVAERL
jgi:hypothetical protein